MEASPDTIKSPPPKAFVEEEDLDDHRERKLQKRVAAVVCTWLLCDTKHEGVVRTLFGGGGNCNINLAPRLQ